MPFSKELISVLVVALLATSAYIWRVESRLEAAQADVGRLEAEKGQLTYKLTESETENTRVRGEMALWRDLYGQLQDDFEQVRLDRETATKRLAELKRRSDVTAFLACPMPDDLYQWVRQN